MSESRALVVIDKNAMVSQDTKRRIITDRDKDLSGLRMLFLCFVIASSVFLVTVSHIKQDQFYSQFAILIVICYFGFVYYTFGKVSQAELPCPLCRESVRLFKPWRCGSCKNENSRETPLQFMNILAFNQDALLSPFDRCSHEACDHPTQTAFECPHCRRHVVLDQDQYTKEQSYSPPLYRYVAEYVDRKPVPTSSSVPHNPSAFRPDKDGSFFAD